MKKNTSYIIITTILILLIISSFVVYAKTNDSKPTLEEKVSEEVEYLDSYIISLLGHFNRLTVGEQIFQTSGPKTQLGKQEEANPQNTKVGQENSSQEGQNNGGQGQNSGGQGQNSGEQSQNGGEGEKSGTGSQENTSNTIGSQTKKENTQTSQQVSKEETSITQNGIFANNGNYDPNWDVIQLHIEQLYQIWNTISLDLHALNIEGSSILAFSDGLNTTTQHIKKKDKQKSMEELKKLYELLPLYMQSCKRSTEKLEILNIKAEVVSSYVAVSSENWQEAKTQLTQTEKRFATILNSVSSTEQNRQNQTTLNQCYILVNELNNAVSLKDKDIFFIQYQNFVTKIGIII